MEPRAARRGVPEQAGAACSAPRPGTTSGGRVGARASSTLVCSMPSIQSAMRCMRASIGRPCLRMVSSILVPEPPLRGAPGGAAPPLRAPAPAPPALARRRLAVRPRRRGLGASESHDPVWRMGSEHRRGSSAGAPPDKLACALQKASATTHRAGSQVHAQCAAAFAAAVNNRPARAPPGVRAR